jgi:hypothetical protein
MDNSAFCIIALVIAPHTAVKEKDLIADFEFGYTLTNFLHNAGAITTQNEG